MPPVGATKDVNAVKKSYPYEVEEKSEHGRGAARSLGMLRLSLGWVFMWAFLDKLFGFGFATKPEAAWINGGSPTMGFLKFGAKGPFVEFFNGLAGNVVVDWLFMIGLLGIGSALILGIGVRIAAASGVAMMALMYAAALLPENNPVVDDHVVYAIALVALAFSNAGRYIGLGKQWTELSIVKRYPILQ